MKLTLRIKRKYFEEILNGTKRMEYRDDKPYYAGLFSEGKAAQFKTLNLHYQDGRFLEADILSIRKIARPNILNNADIKFGPRVWAIKFSNVREKGKLKK